MLGGTLLDVVLHVGGMCVARGGMHMSFYRLVHSIHHAYGDLYQWLRTCYRYRVPVHVGDIMDMG
jgi:hypothetical protein